jgi:hypothetical protein
MINLEKRIDETLQENFLKVGEEGAFIKLATRSAKDTLMESEKLERILRQEMLNVPRGDANGGNWVPV